MGTRKGGYLGAKKTQLAIANDHYRLRWLKCDLLHNPAGGRQWFCEYGMFVDQLVGDFDQIHRGQAKEPGMGAIAPYDTKYGAVCAVACITSQTQFAPAAPCIDFPNDAFTN
jgi:hypothetical protein